PPRGPVISLARGSPGANCGTTMIDLISVTSVRPVVCGWPWGLAVGGGPAAGSAAGAGRTAARGGGLGLRRREVDIRSVPFQQHGDHGLIPANSRDQITVHSARPGRCGPNGLATARRP